MWKHEDFESLCALALIGELPPAEEAELIAHMRSCESCCRSAHEFVDVMQHLPVEGSRVSNSQVPELEESARLQQFLSRALNEGVVFSKDALEAAPRTWRLTKLVPVPAWALGSAMAAVLIFVAAAMLALSRPRPVSVPVFSQGVVQETSGVVPQVNGSSEDHKGRIETDLVQAKEALTAAQQKLSELGNRLEISDNARTNAEAQVRRREQSVVHLQQKLSAEEQQLAEAVADTKKAEGDRNKAVASLVGSEGRLRELEGQLSIARSAVEQERQLNGAARDVRELMGARNLHIIDVYDSDIHSRADRSFGRVIYTEGKSLIFYAFDLDRARNVKKVSFQAWGEREGEHRDPRKLGVFYVDDAAQRRWVMKVNDPDTLRSIDTVFVTVETRNDATAPNHRRLLQAYLGSKANHP